MAKVPETTDVHQALKRAVLVDAMTQSEPTTVKLSPEVKQIATDICKRNGTTLPSFWRECAHVLIYDYSPEAAARLGIVK